MSEPSDLTQVLERLEQVERALEALTRTIADRPAAAPYHVVDVMGLLYAVPTAEWRLAAFLEHRGHPERGLFEILASRVSPGATFIDVGANIGLYTVAVGYAVGAAGHVLAVEPTPQTARALRYNIQLNGLLEGGTVRVVEAAAGAVRGRAILATNEEDSGHNSLYRDSLSHGSVEVDVVPLDELVPAGTRVDVVKVDVEGAELDVLVGMRRIAADNPQIVVFAEFAVEHFLRASRTPESVLEEVALLGWKYDIFETVTGESARFDSADPLTLFLYRELESSPSAPSA